MFIKLLIFYHELIFTTFYFFKHCIKNVSYFIPEFLPPLRFWPRSSEIWIWVNCGFQASGPGPSQRILLSILKRFLSTPAFYINHFSRTKPWSLFIWQTNMSMCYGLPFCVKIRKDTLPQSLQGWPPEVLVSELRNLENSSVSWKSSSYVPPQGIRAYGRYKLNTVVTWIANYSPRQICRSSMLITLGIYWSPLLLILQNMYREKLHFNNLRKGDSWINKVLWYNDTTWILESEREEFVSCINQVSTAWLREKFLTSLNLSLVEIMLFPFEAEVHR